MPAPLSSKVGTAVQLSKAGGQQPPRICTSPILRAVPHCQLGSAPIAGHSRSNAGCQGKQHHVEQPAQQVQPQGLLQQLASAATVAAAAATLLLGTALPPPAEAVLNNPVALAPRTADVALRRSIPAFNQDVRQLQSRLESIGFKLRIPQRKPWQAMSDDLAAAAALAAADERMLAGVLPGDEAEARALLTDLREVLNRLARSIEVKDPDRTSIRVANALEEVANLELLQAPGLPYQLPQQVAGYPALRGRAVVELTVEKASGRRVFVDQDSPDGPQKRAVLQLVLDGYSAPITAANLLSNLRAGLYTGVPLSVSNVSVLAGTQAADAAAPADAAASSGGAMQQVSQQRGAPEAIPLEILPTGDFEPVYRSTLDVRSGELPVLPLSIYGAVAMAHLPDDPGSGYVSGTQFFIYKFDRTQAGLAGLSFDEGEFGVCGYITKGLDALSKLEDGDRIVKAEILSGLDKLS